MAESDSTIPSIEVRNLSYKFQDGSDGLENVSMSLPAGSRTLLIGGESHQDPHVKPFQKTKPKPQQTERGRLPSSGSFQESALRPITPSLSAARIPSRTA